MYTHKTSSQNNSLPKLSSLLILPHLHTNTHSFRSYLKKTWKAWKKIFKTVRIKINKTSTTLPILCKSKLNFKTQHLLANFWSMTQKAWIDGENQKKLDQNVIITYPKCLFLLHRTMFTFSFMFDCVLIGSLRRCPITAM